MQLMKSLDDRKPSTHNIGMDVKAVSWNPKGSMLAICGTVKEGEDKDKNLIKFYNAFGIVQRYLDINKDFGDPFSLGWEKSGHGLFLATD